MYVFVQKFLFFPHRIFISVIDVSKWQTLGGVMVRYKPDLWWSSFPSTSWRFYRHQLPQAYCPAGLISWLLCSSVRNGNWLSSKPDIYDNIVIPVKPSYTNRVNPASYTGMDFLEGHCIVENGYKKNCLHTGRGFTENL